MDDNFENVPFNYLRADRRLFLNTQFLLQLDEIEQKGRDWFVDALVYEPGTQTVFLAEFSFSTSLQGLKGRLRSWSNHWEEIGIALKRDAGFPERFAFRPWAFIPEACVPNMVNSAQAIGFDGASLPALKITPLEMTLPWKYRSWDRIDEHPKPSSIPPEMH